jgi:hypothetical protein
MNEAAVVTITIPVPSVNTAMAYSFSMHASNGASSPTEMPYRLTASENEDEHLHADPCARVRFEILAEWWRQDTITLSSPSRKIAHPAYQRIIALGEPMIPYILEELRDKGGAWFAALEQITQIPLIEGEARYDFNRARSAWLEWGKREGRIARTG